VIYTAPVPFSFHGVGLQLRWNHF